MMFAVPNLGPAKFPHRVDTEFVYLAVIVAYFVCLASAVHSYCQENQSRRIDFATSQYCYCTFHLD